jgi:hypothetical protein
MGGHHIDGTLKYSVPAGAGGRSEAQVGPNDYLESLRIAMMISGEARKGRRSVITDFIYLDFSSEESSVTEQVDPFSSNGAENSTPFALLLQPI